MAEWRDAGHKAIHTAIDHGLEAYCDELNAQSDRFTPEWRGDLKKAKYFEKIGPGQFVVVTGDGGPTPHRPVARYVARQYYDDQRHRGDFSSGLKNLVALYRGTNGPRKARMEGNGDRYMYNRAYEMAVRDGRLTTNLGSPLWYERAQKDVTMQKKRERAFRSRFVGVA